MQEKFFYTLNNYMIVFMFSIAILIPFFLSIMEIDKTVSTIEKRELSKLPAMPNSISDIKAFPQLFDNYYSDHFGLRNLFIFCYNQTKYYIGDSSSKNVTLGKDGWLFLGSVKKDRNTSHYDPIGDVRNVNLYTLTELKKFAKNITNLNDWLEKQKIKYMFVIAPNKHTIYFEQLPDYIHKVNKKSATDQLVEYLKTYTTVRVVDLRNALMKEKNQHQLYMKLDTHWNHHGANIAQYEIMKEIKKIFPDQILPQLQKINEVKHIGGGDLLNMIGLGMFEVLVPHPVFKECNMLIKYPPDAGVESTHTWVCQDQKLNILIFKDSFFNAMVPYFSRKFKRSTYIHEKVNYTNLIKYIKLEKPDMVIEEWIERTLPFVYNDIIAQ